MKIIFLTAFQILSLFCGDAELKTLSPITSSDLESAIADATAGDVISLSPIDYTGDFTLVNSGTSGYPITIRGTSDNQNKNTKIIGSSGAFTVKGNYWSLESLEIEKGDFAVNIEGSHNTVSGLAIHDVKKAILIKGSDNIVEDNAIKSRGTGISVEKGDRNKIMRSAISLKNPSINIFANTCCGLIDSNTFQGPTQLNGNRYIISGNVAQLGVRIEGCDNEFSKNVFRDVFFTKSCRNSDAGMNVYNGVADKAQPFDMEKIGSDSGSGTIGNNNLPVSLVIITNVIFFAYSFAILHL